MEPDPADLDRARAGDIGALEALYRACGGRVYRLARGILGQAADAEDATQEVFLRAFAKLDRFGGRARFTTWISRMTINHCLNHRRDRRRRPRLLGEAGEDALPAAGNGCPETATADKEDRERAFALLQLLPGPQRAVVVLREIEGLGYREIAGILGLPEGTVMSRLSRARRRLEDLVAHDGHERTRA